MIIEKTHHFKPISYLIHLCRYFTISPRIQGRGRLGFSASEWRYISVLRPVDFSSDQLNSDVVIVPRSQEFSQTKGGSAVVTIRETDGEHSH